MKTLLKSTVLLAAGLAVGLSAWVATPTTIHAQDAACSFPKAPDDFEQEEIDKLYAVSYTHLTLPTILLV